MEGSQRLVVHRHFVIVYVTFVTFKPFRYRYVKLGTIRCELASRP